MLAMTGIINKRNCLFSVIVVSRIKTVCCSNASNEHFHVTLNELFYTVDVQTEEEGLNEWVEWSSTFRKKITSPVMLEEENIVLGRKATNTDGSTIEEFFKITRNEKETILDEMDKQV